MDGPETILYGTTLVSQSYPVTVEAFVHAATMSTPGAVKSGCIIMSRICNSERDWATQE